MGFGRHDRRAGRRRRGTALPAFMSVAMLGLAAVLFVLLRPTIGGVVTDEYSGEPLGGVRLDYAGQRVRSDGRGRFTLMPQRGAGLIVPEAPPGYACAPLDFRSDPDRRLAITCRPNTLSGTLRRKQTDAPLPGIVVRAVNAAGERTAEAITDDDGHYALASVPADARLIVEGAGFARREVPIDRATVLDLELHPDVAAGRVTDRQGNPIAGATVGAPGVATTTAKDGGYTLVGLPEEGRVTARAPGFRALARTPGDEPRLDFALEPLVVRAIYLNPEAVADEATFNAFLALADRTEINAIVIDVKDEAGRLLYDSRVPLAREIGAVRPSYDLGARLRAMREHNVYAIARIVCMLDPTLARARPEWAVRNRKTGGIWKNNAGIAWVNAMRPEAWRYNADLALEAAALGFDEVQYDYVRFPSDGDLEAIDLGVPNTLAARVEAVQNLLKLARDALAPYGVALAADIFGIALWEPQDTGIGQQLERLLPVVDYLCPMIYPSHFSSGSFGYPIPNDHPYEVILESLRNAEKRVPGSKAKLRPWLQDFTYGPGIDYGPNEVRAQIKATYDFGVPSWMLWNASNTYTVAALQPKKR